MFMKRKNYINIYKYGWYGWLLHTKVIYKRMNIYVYNIINNTSTSAQNCQKRFFPWNIIKKAY